jgi:hypothetical protein
VYKRQCKDIAVNRVLDIEETGGMVDPAQIAREVRDSFPYKSIPKGGESRARNFYVGTLCELVAGAVAKFSSRDEHNRKG